MCRLINIFLRFFCSIDLIARQKYDRTNIACQASNAIKLCPQCTWTFVLFFLVCHSSFEANAVSTSFSSSFGAHQYIIYLLLQAPECFCASIKTLHGSGSTVWWQLWTETIKKSAKRSEPVTGLTLSLFHQLKTPLVNSHTFKWCGKGRKRWIVQWVGGKHGYQLCAAFWAG